MNSYINLYKISRILSVHNSKAIFHPAQLKTVDGEKQISAGVQTLARVNLSVQTGEAFHKLLLLHAYLPC